MSEGIMFVSRCQSERALVATRLCRCSLQSAAEQRVANTAHRSDVAIDATAPASVSAPLCPPPSRPTPPAADDNDDKGADSVDTA